jgi:uncharacterized RDD family membrane protein YckC
MNNKIRYFIKRALSALIDLIIFAIVLKTFGYIWNNGNGETNLPSIIVFPMYYLFFFIQDFFFKKTIGKFIFNLELVLDQPFQLSYFHKAVKFLFRRSFDFLEIICPFLYIIFILVNKKNKKLGDYLTGIVVVNK